MTKILKIAMALQIFMILLNLLGVITNTWVIFLPATIIFAIYAFIGMFTHVVFHVAKFELKNLDKSLLNATIGFIEDNYKDFSQSGIEEAYEFIDQYENDIGIDKANRLRAVLGGG